jgi:hypothetical protein
VTPEEGRQRASEFVDAILEGEPMKAGKAGPHRVTEGPSTPPNNNALFWVGLVACVLVAVAAQAHTLPEPWSHIVSMLGTIGASVNGYLIKR